MRWTSSARAVLTVVLVCGIPSVSSALLSATSTNPQCQKWYQVMRDMQANLFNGGVCNDHARQSVRIAFHDAIGRSTKLWAAGKFGGGGADGSIIQFADIELQNPGNKGLEDIVSRLKVTADKHKVGYGDIIQLAGAVGLSDCPGGARLAFFSGRPPAVAPAPDGLTPGPKDSPQKILSRMADAGLSSEDTVALLGAHSIGKQHTVNPAVDGAPLDSTPGKFDSQFYLETLLNGTTYPGKNGIGHGTPGEALSPSKKQFRLASDFGLATYPRTACIWQSFIGDEARFRDAFRRAMLKVANDGYEDLVDCSDIIPDPLAYTGVARYPKDFSRMDVVDVCHNGAFPYVPGA